MEKDILDNLDELMTLNERIEVLSALLIDELVIPHSEFDNAPEVLANSIKDLSNKISDALDVVWKEACSLKQSEC